MRMLPILSSYPSFNTIPDRKVETCIEQFSQNCGEKIIPHSFESYKTRGKNQFPIVLNCKPRGKDQFPIVLNCKPKGKDQFPIVCEDEPEEWGFSLN